MAIHTLFFISCPGVKNRSMGQHGSPLIRNMEDIPMAFLALFVFEGCIGCIPGFLVVVFVLNKMEYDIFDAVHGFGIKEIKGIMWGRKMAVHTVCDKSLGIVHMG